MEDLELSYNKRRGTVGRCFSFFSNLIPSSFPFVKVPLTRSIFIRCLFSILFGTLLIGLFLHRMYHLVDDKTVTDDRDKQIDDINWNEVINDLPNVLHDFYKSVNTFQQLRTRNQTKPNIQLVLVDQEVVQKEVEKKDKPYDVAVEDDLKWIKQEFEFFLSHNIKRRPTVDFALHVICHGKYWKRLVQLFESINLQTVSPSEFILVLNLEEDQLSSITNQNTMSTLHPFDFSIFDTLSPNTNTSVYFRSGKISPGKNREFASRRSSADILSFFDCDDYMHPQRTEILYKLFKNHPDVDISLHNFYHVAHDHLDKVKHKFVTVDLFSQHQIDTVQPDLDFEQIRRQLPTRQDMEMVPRTIEKGPRQKDWVMGDKTSEPNWNPDFNWFFAQDMDLKWPNGDKVYLPHNAWSTVRREVVEKIEFPDLFIGEDSLFNWRAIKYGFNFTAVHPNLGLYISYA